MIPLYILMAIFVCQHQAQENAPDNALDACRTLEGDKWVRAKLTFEGSLFVISVVNPVRRRVTVNGNRPPTTKDDPGTHGYGLGNVAAALESYGGSYELYNTDDTFQFTTVVPLPSSKEGFHPLIPQ